MKERLISVIIPVYKVEKYLCRCIDSIINQTYKNLEIILIDDGSPDNCGKICDEYAQKDDRIKVIHKNNEGLSQARNDGLKICNGYWISFIDSDDWIDTDSYEVLLKSSENIDADIIIFGSYNQVDDEDEYTDVHNDKVEVLNSETAIKYMLTNNIVTYGMCDKIYKKEILKEEVFPINKTSEDIFLQCKYFSLANNILILPYSKYHYTIRKNSISRNRTFTLDYIDATKYQMDFINNNFPNLSCYGKSVYAYSNIETYNRYLINNIKININIKKQMINEVKKYKNDILKNEYLNIIRKVQALIFIHDLPLYNFIFKLKRGKKKNGKIKS